MHTRGSWKYRDFKGSVVSAAACTAGKYFGGGGGGGDEEEVDGDDDVHVNTATSGAGLFLRGRRLLPQRLVQFLRIERRFAPFFLSFASFLQWFPVRNYIGGDLWTKETNVYIYIFALDCCNSSSSIINNLLALRPIIGRDNNRKEYIYGWITDTKNKKEQGFD